MTNTINTQITLNKYYTEGGWEDYQLIFLYKALQCLEVSVQFTQNGNEHLTTFPTRVFPK